MSHPPVQPHGPIEEVWDDVFRVRGSVRMGPGVRIPRNMAIVREGRDLTLIHAVRLSPEAEGELEELGTVRHVVKIGTHGMDDAYSVERFGATRWALPGVLAEEIPHRELVEGGELPLTDARLFVFRETAEPEAAILLERDGGVLLTCDSLQHWVSLEGCSALGKLATKLMGFMHPVNIGPPWRRMQTKEGGSLRPDFERLLELPFEHLLGGHGDPARGGARDALRRTIERVYG